MKSPLRDVSTRSSLYVDNLQQNDNTERTFLSHPCCVGILGVIGPAQ